MKTVILILLFFSFSGWTQWLGESTWVYDNDFLYGPSPHGIVIDNAGLIWVGWYAYTDSLGFPNDTIPVAPIYVYNADGTQAAFSPIYTVTVDGVTDTIDTYCRGLSLDHNGNILFVGNQVMYRINYLTGEGMNKYLYPAAGSLTSAACDANGYIYLTKVVPVGGPFIILDEDFDPYGFVLDSCFTIQRSCLVSSDGNDVYLPIIYASGGNNGVIRYHSDNGPDGPYAIVDTLYRGALWGQCADWDRNGLMWVGSYWDIGTNDWGGWYGLDPMQDFSIVDTLRHFVGNRGPLAPGVPAGSYFWSPRHAAWSLDNEFMYTCDFDGHVIKRWKNRYSSVPDENFSHNISDFVLMNNYPNPFNPKTKLVFEIRKPAFVKLEVFNMLGQKVKTLVNNHLLSKRYEIEFDATGLPSGAYFFRLTAENHTKTGKMLLIK